MVQSFAPDSKITEIVKKQSFTLSAEVIPPRNGGGPGPILDQINRLTSNGAQFLAVTKGAGGSLRGGSLPIAQLIKDRFQRPCIAHFTCRDLVPEEVENQLIDHHLFGIRNILALRGDPPLNADGWKAREESYPYAYMLIEQIRNLNEGIYLERDGFKVEAREKTDFCIGAAAYPDSPDSKERIDYFKMKIDAGATYAFGRSAAPLSPREAALLAAMLPTPHRRSARTPGPGMRRLSGTYMVRARSVDMESCRSRKSVN